MTTNVLKVVGVVLFAGFATNTSLAEITWSGDLDPADPTTWTSDTNAFIGNIASGTLNITSDSDISSKNGFIGGTEPGVTGVVWYLSPTAAPGAARNPTPRLLRQTGAPEPGADAARTRSE